MSKPRSKTNSTSKRKGGHFLSRKDDAIQWFQREGFEPAEFIGLLKSEKELDQARNDLTQLNEYCKEEVQKVVHAHHKDFLEASRNLQDVEVLVDELRNYVSGSVAVVANLVDLPALPKQASSSSSLTAESPNGPGQAPSAWEGILALQAELMQDLQVAVAEHDVSLARALLSAGKDIIAVVDRDGAQLTPQANGDGLPAWRHAFESALAAQKAILIEELQRELSHTKSSMLERRQAAQNLGLVVGPSQATQALLGCHSLRVRAAQQHLLKQHSAAGGDPDGVEYAGGLAQRTFLAIGAAAEDVRAVFPSPTASGPGVQEPDGGGGGAQVAAVLPQVSALVVQWASDEARHCASLLCRHALTPFAATGMAVGALLCVGLALAFCVALESTHGLALRVAFAEELWPLVEVVVRRHLHRLREEASASASVDATNAALQAVAGSGSAAAPAAASGIGLALPVLADVNGPSSAPTPYSGIGGAVQEGLPDLFPRADLQAAPAVPAGLTCLSMLVPELKALAEGLASLASRPAVAVLRQGVQAIFKAVCERVHVSLARLVGSCTGAGGAKEGGPQGPLLAAYVAKAEKRLRLFAESDVQAALEPLSYVCGPVAPPELLVACLAPLSDLLSKLPEAAHDAAPAEPDPSQAAALRTQSSGLLDRIRAQLEAEQGQGRGERDSWRPSDALGPSVGTVAAAAVSSAGAGVGTPGAAAAPTAAAATAQPPGMQSISLPPPAPPPAREAEQPGKATALARGATVLDEAGAQGGGQAVSSRQAGRRTPDAPEAAIFPEEGGTAGDVPVGQAGGVASRRRPQPPVETELEPEQQIERQQRRGILRHPSGRVGPTPAAVQAAKEEVSNGQAGRTRSRSRERGGRASGRGAATGIESGDSPDEGYVPGRWRRQASPRGPEQQLATMEEDPAGAGAQQRQRPGGLNRVRREQLEGGAAVEVPPSSGARTNAAAPRSRQGQERFVRFEQLPDSATSAAEGAGVSGTDQEDAPVVLQGRAKPQRGAAASRGQPPMLDSEKPAPRSRAAVGRTGEWEDDPADSPPPVSPGRRARPTDPQRRQVPQLETASPRSGSRYGEADVAAPIARRNRVAVDTEQGAKRGVPDVKPLPSSDEELPQPRRTREPPPERGRADDADDPFSAAAAGKAPRSSERTAGRPVATQNRVAQDDEAMASTRLAVSSASNASSAAAPARPRSDLPEGGNRPTAGGVGRKPNRFGVVLSDDEDEPAAVPRLRRPRAAAAASAASDATAAVSGGADEEQFRGTADGRNGAAAEGALVAVQAAAARSERRRERLGLPEERGSVTAEEDPLLAARRPARHRHEPVAAEQQQRQQQQERGDMSGHEAPAAAAGPKMDPQPRGGFRPSTVPAAPDGPGEIAAGTGGGGGAGTGAEGVASKPQTARERLAARMAAKAAATEGLL